jgi:uncharacterized iron-regulated protein
MRKQIENLAGGAVLGSALFCSSVTASDVPDDIVNRMAQADVVLLGEVHDNPVHHRLQAELLTRLRPRAVVWEMITEDRASILTPDLLTDPSQLQVELEWDQSGWPDFSLYAPVFAAAPEAAHFGALVSRDATEVIMQDGILSYFGSDSAKYGLDDALSDADQTTREAYQLAAHCDALPQEMLPMMVDFQRLRDAQLARVTMQALDDTGGPVVVITGNGHARRDRGVPVYLKHAQPDLNLFSLGQSEDGLTSGVFDMVLDAPAVDRPDPCLAFSKN